MSNRKFRRGISSVLLLAVTGGSVPLALAQSDEERAGARAAADAGLKAHDGKKWSECVDYFTRAESLVHAPPHVLYLARCNAQLGHLVKAREAYLRLKNEVVAPGKPKAFHDAKLAAEKELSALEPRLPYFDVKVVGANGKPVTVTMDGAVVPPALVGIPHPVDPGEHKFQATAEGMASTMQTGVAKEGQSGSVTLELIALTTAAPPATVKPEPATVEPEPTTTAPAATTSAPPLGTTAPPVPPTDTGDGGGGGGLRTVGFVTAGVGVVGLVLGGVFLAQSGSKKKEADDLFGANACDVFCAPDVQAQVKDLDAKSNSARTLGLVAGGVGVLALGAGITLILVGGSKSESKAVARVQPVVGLGTFGIRGSF